MLRCVRKGPCVAGRHVCGLDSGEDTLHGLESEQIVCYRNPKEVAGEQPRAVARAVHREGKEEEEDRAQGPSSL